MQQLGGVALFAMLLAADAARKPNIVWFLTDDQDQVPQGHSSVVDALLLSSVVAAPAAGGCPLHAEICNPACHTPSCPKSAPLTPAAIDVDARRFVSYKEWCHSNDQDQSRDG